MKDSSRLPPSLRDRVLASSAAAPPVERIRLLPLALVGSAWIATFATLVGRRANWSVLPVRGSWGALLEIALVAGLTTALALAPGKAMVGPAARWVIAALAGPLLLALGLHQILAVDVTPTPPDRFFALTLPCVGGVVVAATPLIVLVLRGLRGRVFVAPLRSGAVAGIAVACWGHALVHWSCVYTDFAHVVVGHLLPVVPLAVAGALLVRRAQRRPVAQRARR